MLKFFSLKGMMAEIDGYGFTYSLKKYFTTLSIVILATIGAGVFYEMNLVALIIIIGLEFLCMPSIVRAQFVFMYKQKRFNDVDVYLHQMVYSFQKTPKITLALIDTYRISDGQLKSAVGAAIEEFNSSVSNTVMEDALAHIEEVYPTEKIKTLHKYLISIEKRGGSYQESMQVLLGDFDRWVKRVYKRQEDLKFLKRDTMIGILITMFVGSITVFVTKVLGGSEIGANISISNELLYQAGCVIFLACCIFYYTYIQSHFNGEWLSKVRTEEAIIRDMKIVEDETYVRSVRMKSIPLYVIFLIIGVAFLFIGGTFFSITAAIVLFFVCILLITPDLDKSAAKKRITDDVYNAFSEWMRDVAINLQHKPLQAAIEDTYNDCPIVMKGTLGRFIMETHEKPTAVEPYHELMSEFGILDISSAVSSLYAFSEVDVGDIDASVGTIIQRNYELVDKREEKADKDAASLRGMLHYIPSIFVAMKVSIDMILILTNYL